MHCQTLKSKKDCCKLKLKKLLSNLSEIDSSNSAFISSLNVDKINQQIESITEKDNNSLSGLLYTMKNLASIKGNLITGGSQYFQKYISPYSSTVFKILSSAKAINAINSNLDEFGMSGTGLHSHYGKVHNPYSKHHMIGGSSSGSAYLVSKQLVDFAIVSDTGDSARVPASNSHIYGYKPSYGLVSRFGFFPFCSQFDTVGIMANDIDTISKVMTNISINDPNDLTTANTKSKNYSLYLMTISSEPIKIAVFKDTFVNASNPSNEITDVEKQFEELKKKLQKDSNIQITTVSFDPELLHLCSLIYCVVAYAESISNYLNVNGLLFPFLKDQDGNCVSENIQNTTDYESLLLKSRKKLGKEVVFRQLLGSCFLHEENYKNIYLKSKKLLTLINQKVDLLFKDYDFVISPTANDSAAMIKDYQKTYSNNNINNILLLPNFCGLPSISMPWIFINELPVGLHIFSKYNNDANLFQLVNYLKINNFI